MEFVRVVTHSDILKDIVKLPDSLLHQEVEIIILPVGESTSNPVKSKQSFSARGSLSMYANEKLRDSESNGWQKAVENKHEHR